MMWLHSLSVYGWSESNQTRDNNIRGTKVENELLQLEPAFGRLESTATAAMPEAATKRRPQEILV
jgi:hypothetical protein